jgi:hypothetical protein
MVRRGTAETVAGSVAATRRRNAGDHPEIFYLGNDPVVLAAAHIATGPVFAVIVTVTIVLARRAMPGNPSPGANPGRP